ncbi:MAG: hypothetical protein JSV86_07290 [Gemmatimonadota bacterium]|nr:MAG: hypothetical protein JSV86_07290 [Gemmatimonadota bacterium]
MDTLRTLLKETCHHVAATAAVDVEAVDVSFARFDGVWEWMVTVRLQVRPRKARKLQHVTASGKHIDLTAAASMAIEDVAFWRNEWQGRQ